LIRQMSAAAPSQKKGSDALRECKRVLKYLKDQPDASVCPVEIKRSPAHWVKFSESFGCRRPILAAGGLEGLGPWWLPHYREATDGFIKSRGK
jgi:hypothetical protein